MYLLQTCARGYGEIVDLQVCKSVNVKIDREQV